MFSIFIQKYKISRLIFVKFSEKMPKMKLRPYSTANWYICESNLESKYSKNKLEYILLIKSEAFE